MGNKQKRRKMLKNKLFRSELEKMHKVIDLNNELCHDKLYGATSGC